MQTVTVTPRFPNDTNGDPVADGDPIELTPLEIAPGNTVLRYGFGGDLDDVEFTVFFPLLVWRGAGEGYVHADELIKDGYGISVGDRNCTARVQKWQSQRSGRGGLVVLAHSATGKGS